MLTSLPNITVTLKLQSHAVKVFTYESGPLSLIFIIYICNHLSFMAWLVISPSPGVFALKQRKRSKFHIVYLFNFFWLNRVLFCWKKTTKKKTLTSIFSYTFFVICPDRKCQQCSRLFCKQNWKATGGKSQFTFANDI